MNKKNRTGETRLHKRTGQMMEIITYHNSNNITVRLSDGTIIRKVEYAQFKNGYARRTGKKYYGMSGVVGPKGDGDRKVSQYWYRMIYYSSRKPEDSDIGARCTMCTEWKNYYNFEKWFKENYYKVPGEKMVLDKDILVPHRRPKVYGPDTCIIVPWRVSSTIKSGNNGYRTGLRISSRRVSASIRINGKTTLIGSYKTEEEAFAAYKAAKEESMHRLAEEYGDKLPEKVIRAILAWEYVPDKPEPKS